MGALLLTSCGKDNKDNEVLIGKWTNTAQSYEITIDGRQNITDMKKTDPGTMKNTIARYNLKHQ